MGPHLPEINFELAFCGYPSKESNARNSHFKKTNHLKRNNSNMDNIDKEIEGNISKNEENRARSTSIKIRMLPSEKELIEDALKASSYNYFTDMILDVMINKRYEVISLDPNLQREYMQIITELKRIGNNFNQLNKQIHSKKLNYFTEEDVKNISNTLKEISDFYKEIKQHIR